MALNLGGLAENPLSSELVEWADLILVMEKQHQRKLAEKFRVHLSGTQVACLCIPDNYAFMEDSLVEMLQRKVEPYLVRADAAGSSTSALDGVALG